MDDLLFTIVGYDYHNGSAVFKKGDIVKLVKDPKNEYDNECINIYVNQMGLCGNIANNYHTIKEGTMSAGRLYDKILDEDYAIIEIKTMDKIIGRVLSNDELKKELKNEDSVIYSFN